MKRFLKRMNRGLVLGAILLIALIIYIVADTRSFSKAKPELKDLADTFVCELMDAGVTPEAYRTLDAACCSDACVNEIKANMQEVINKHMTPADSAADNTSMYGYYYGKNQAELLDIHCDTAPQYYGYVTEVNVDLRSGKPDISKSGVDLAKVLVQYDFDAEYVGNPYFHLPALDVPLRNSYANESHKYTDEVMKASGYVYLELTMKKTDGTWRIAYVDWLDYNLMSQNSDSNGDLLPEYDMETDTELMMGGY